MIHFVVTGISASDARKRKLATTTMWSAWTIASKICLLSYQKSATIKKLTRKISIAPANSLYVFSDDGKGISSIITVMKIAMTPSLRVERWPTILVLSRSFPSSRFSSICWYFLAFSSLKYFWTKADFIFCLISLPPDIWSFQSFCSLQEQCYHTTNRSVFYTSCQRFFE